MKKQLVLGIETSCDDTSVCLLEGTPEGEKTILSHLSGSSEALLREWGGVVPEIAARDHLNKITPLLKKCFEEAERSPAQVDLIGVTTLPGLLGPLLTGINAAKTLAMIHQKPLIGVNHLFAHLEAIHLSEKISSPYLGLLVSGGHSLFLLMRKDQAPLVIGTTVDDAAGEAFDKGGKLLGLPYPSGRIIDELAKKGKPGNFRFPIGLQHSKDARLSFSGLKTSMRNLLEDKPELKEFDLQNPSEQISNLCHDYQEAIVEALRLKTIEAQSILKEKGFSNLPLVIGGGVACNSRLREIFKKNFSDCSFVEPKFCTDNGAMIANYALLNSDKQIPFPDCLSVDATSRFIQKTDYKKGNPLK